MQLAIETHLNEKSNVASNRLVINKNPVHENYKQPNPARYLEDTRSVLYKMFPNSDEISKSTFYKYSHINGEYKKAHRYLNIMILTFEVFILTSILSKPIKKKHFT
jgi:hypothetical protein